jgi:hypothetical protein
MTFKQETQHKPPFPTQKKKRFGLLGQQLTGDIKPEKKEYKESSFKEDIVQNDEENIHHSKKESLRIQTQCLDSNTDHLMTPLSFQKEVPYSLEEYARRHSRNTNEDMWGSPFEIKRPNCIPGFSTISLDDLEELPSPIDTLSFGDEEDFGEDIYNTNKSNTPSSSGDSGYGTTRKSSSLSSHRNSRTISGSTRVAEHFHAMFTPEPSKTHPIQSTVTDPDVTPASLSSLFQNSTPTKKKSSSLSARPSQETCVRETKAATLSHKSTRKNRTSSQEWQTTLQRKHEIEKSCRRKERKVSDVPTDHLELRDENNQLVARYVKYFFDFP